MRQRAGAVVIHKGQLLVIKRVKPSGEYYVVPGGGVEGEETFAQAAERELLEETSVVGRAKKFLFERRSTAFGHEEFWLCEYVSGTPQLGDGPERVNMTDSNQYHPMWIPLNNLPDNLVPEEMVFLLTTALEHDEAQKRYTHGAFGVVHKDAKILLVQLPPWAKEANKWSIPGGVVEPNEQPEAGAVREIYEETGIRCTITNKLTDLPTGDLRLSFYLADYLSGEIRLQDDEIQAADWFSFDEATKLDLAYENTVAVLTLARKHL